jgi:hypothetical protein
MKDGARLDLAYKLLELCLPVDKAGHLVVLFASCEYVFEVLSIIIQVRGDDGAKCLDWFRNH